jgi:hypothetical protein
MKSKPTGIESIAIRRAVIADSDKVRYRVYSSPTEFIAVIAESALMAVKVSGISKPHKIVRDLPTEGIAIEAKKMASIDPNALRITLPTEKTESEKQLVAQLGAERNMEKEKQESFKAMNIADLQNKGGPRARILPPEMLSEIIEQHTRATMPQAASPEPLLEAAPAPQPLPKHEEPTPQMVAPPSEPELSPEEKLLKLADEALVPAPAATPKASVEPLPLVPAR